MFWDRRLSGHEVPYLTVLRSGSGSDRYPRRPTRPAPERLRTRSASGTSEASPRTLLSIPPHRNRHGGVPPIRCFGKGARKFIGSLFKLQISLSCSH